jgi:hypothetical protein
MPNSLRHLKFDLETLKQVQVDTLVGGVDKMKEHLFSAYSMQLHFGKNDSMREMRLPYIQSPSEASCPTRFGISRLI